MSARLYTKQQTRTCYEHTPVYETAVDPNMPCIGSLYTCIRLNFKPSNTYLKLDKAASCMMM